MDELKTFNTYRGPAATIRQVDFQLQQHQAFPAAASATETQGPGLDSTARIDKLNTVDM